LLHGGLFRKSPDDDFLGGQDQTLRLEQHLQFTEGTFLFDQEQKRVDEFRQKLVGSHFKRKQSADSGEKDDFFADQASEITSGGQPDLPD
jgi:hypothetical protein